jgi:hypothetical protein
VDELDSSREDFRRHHHPPDAGHVLSVVVAEQREHPRDEFRVAVRGNGTGHDADRLALVRQRDTLPDDAIQVRVFLGEVKVEMEPTCDLFNPDFRFGRGTLRPQNRRRTSIVLGPDATNPATEGDSLWVKKNPSR